MQKENRLQVSVFESNSIQGIKTLSPKLKPPRDCVNSLPERLIFKQLKHKIMKKNSNTPKPQNKHLLAAAKLLTDKIDSPADLLQFVTDMVTHYVNYSLDNYNLQEKIKLSNSFFGIHLLVYELVIPWMKGGKDVLDNIAKGLYDRYQYGRYQSYYDTIGDILLAHSYGFQDGTPSEESQRKELSIIQTLSEVGHFLRLYEEEKEKKAA